MRIDICCGREVAVAQPFLNFLHGYPVLQQQAGTSMPLRYNKDKSENRCGATNFGFVFILFPFKKAPETGAMGEGDKSRCYINDKNLSSQRSMKYVENNGHL